MGPTTNGIEEPNVTEPSVCKYDGYMQSFYGMFIWSVACLFGLWHVYLVCGMLIWSVAYFSTNKKSVQSTNKKIQAEAHGYVELLNFVQYLGNYGAGFGELSQN
ncbi:hypothetical protein U1Q18_046430 [Sarracenia purpurea var. burkii]